MAAEMSCLTGVDADDNDGDPEINALALMQEPLGMSSCADAFSKSLCQSDSVLDVLSREDMLSPVGLGNGPSVHQPTEAHELNSFTNDKEEEKNITPLKTVQEIGGMWDFDIDSPEDSSDNFDTPCNNSWDSHKNFMQFLESWDHGDSPGEDPKEEAPPPEIPKRRKRKMDMVVMIDPSEELFSSEDDEEDILVSRKPRLSPSRTSPSRKLSKYTNGTVKPIKHVIYSPATEFSKQNNISHELLPLKSKITTNSYSEKALQYPCSKCKLIFKTQHLLDYHMKSHTEQLRPYVCKECGKSFKKSGFLIEHMAVHKQNQHSEKKSSKDKPQILYCPQCSFGTKCPNEFVQHAKTHQKEKRKLDYLCEQCSFKTDELSVLKKHKVIEHPVASSKKPERKPEKSTFTCIICCSYKTFSKLVFTKHLLKRHDLSVEEYEAEHGDISATPKQTVDSSKIPLKDAMFTSKMSFKSSTTPKKVLPTVSKSISDYFKDSSLRRGPKLFQTEFKLDKPIHVPLSQPRHGPIGINQRQETNGNGCEKDPYELPESPLSQSDQVLSESDRSLQKSPHHRTSSDEDPKPPSPNRHEEEDVDMFAKRDLSPFRDADSNHIDSIFKRQKQIIYTYSRRMSMRGALQASKKLYEKIKSEEQEHSDVDVKDEDTDDELVIENESAQPENYTEDEQANNPDRKNCPYCIAVFESGVGLSNHIRGHLHRIRVNHKARHKFLTYQETKSEAKSHVGSPAPSKKEPKEPKDSVVIIHSCPLCGDFFDNRTGQANHIRGHLKKLGKGLIAKNRSPLILLRELMRDKKEYKRALQIIGKRNHVQYRPSSKLSDFHSFTPRSTDSVKDNCTDAKPLTPKPSFDDIISEKGQQETNLDLKNSLSGNSALIGILKKRKCQEDSKPVISTNNEQSSVSRLGSSLPNSVSEKDGFKRKTCIHCHGTFHSGVSLSNHLRACSRRRKNALSDGNALDGKVRRQRMRPGPKKKILPQPQTPDEMYRLTCRFCDLVFQGPLSVQEDWVKHLQRHIMNTSVPHTGLAMLEVSSVPKEPRKYEKHDHDAYTSASC